MRTHSSLRATKRHSKETAAAKCPRLMAKMYLIFEVSFMVSGNFSFFIIKNFLLERNRGIPL